MYYTSGMTVLDYFSLICKVPRESGNENGIRSFLVSWAVENGFPYAVDTCGNLVIYRKATPGYENVPPLALQGHMDMVCVKTANSSHDFLKDPIEPVEKDGFLYAKDTSLGADNGIALAMTMALFTDPEAQHGPLEAVFTVSEETSLKGAFGLDPSLVKSRRMINLDSEEEGVIYIGCAGGADIKASYTADISPVPEGYEAVYLKVCGMKGGHSGGEIHRQRANAVRVLVNMLDAVSESGYRFMLSRFNGGERHNVIPSEAECVICVKPEEKKTIVHDILLGTFEKLKQEYRSEDPQMKCEHCCSAHNPALKVPAEAASFESTERIVQTLLCVPHGVKSFSTTVKGIVKTSDNLAIVSLENGKLNMSVSVRSLSEYSKNRLIRRILLILGSFGMTTCVTDGYPAWTPDNSSELCRIFADEWKKFTGKDAVVTSIHAGLECGVINSRIGGMDSISVGPDIFEVHSVNEHISIDSANRFYGFLKHLVGAIKE